MTQQNRLLGGENIRPATNKQARALIGKRVEYLRNQDLDKSGRGYFFPQRGIVEEVVRRNVRVDEHWMSINDIVEMKEIQ